MLVKIWILNNSHWAGRNRQYIIGHTSQEYPVFIKEINIQMLITIHINIQKLNVNTKLLKDMTRKSSSDLKFKKFIGVNIYSVKKN